MWQEIINRKIEENKMSDFMNLKDDLISRSNLLMHLNDYALQEAPFRDLLSGKLFL